MDNIRISTLLKGVNISFFVGVGVWVCLILIAAYRLSKLAGSATEAIIFGPLTLTHLTTEISQGRTTVSFSLEYGLLLYLLFWAATGLSCSLFWLRRNKR